MVGSSQIAVALGIRAASVPALLVELCAGADGHSEMEVHVMRNLITKPKTLRRLEALVGKPIALAMTRGGTHHRIDIACTDGTVYALYPHQAPTLTAHRYDPVLHAIVLSTPTQGRPR
jgi:hypothetical protein